MRRYNLFGRHFGNSKLPSLNSCLVIYLLLIYNNKELLIDMPLLVSGLRIPIAMSNCCLDLVKLKTLKYIMALGRCLWIHHSTSYPKLFLLQKNSPCTHFYVHSSLWTFHSKIISRITLTKKLSAMSQHLKYKKPV